MTQVRSPPDLPEILAMIHGPRDLDAMQAALEAVAREHLAAPRARGDREAMRAPLTTRQGAISARTKAIGQLKAPVVNVPKRARSTTSRQRRGATQPLHRPRTLLNPCVVDRATVHTISVTARRKVMLEAEAAEYKTELELLS